MLAPLPGFRAAGEFPFLSFPVLPLLPDTVETLNGCRDFIISLVRILLTWNLDGAGSHSPQERAFVDGLPSPGLGLILKDPRDGVKRWLQPLD